jgi:hypothetical protein
MTSIEQPAVSHGLLAHVLMEIAAAAGRPTEQQADRSQAQTTAPLSKDDSVASVPLPRPGRT